MGFPRVPYKIGAERLCICYFSPAVCSGGVCLFLEKRHLHYLPCILRHPQEPKAILILKLSLIHGMPWDAPGYHRMPCVKASQCLSNSQVALSALILHKAWGAMRMPLGYIGMSLETLSRIESMYLYSLAVWSGGVCVSFF